MKRRSWLRVLGGGAVVVGTLVLVDSLGSRVTVPAGEQRQFTVGSGETLANLLIDITADGADAQIVADGDDWTIRNVGFKGKMDRGASNGGFSNLIKPHGNGLVDHVYMGDGAYSGVNAGGIGMPSSHSGHIEVRNSHFAEWTDNALYNANAADNGGGTVHVDNCYFRDNNVAHLRVAAHGSRVENTVVHNTEHVPRADGGVLGSSGAYTGYGDPEQVVTFRNCDVDVTPAATGGSANAFWSPADRHRNAPCSTLRVVDSRVVGRVVGLVELLNVGPMPDTAIPRGVPRTPAAATR